MNTQILTLSDSAVTRLRPTQLLLPFIISLFLSTSAWPCAFAFSTTQELTIGFSATPNLSVTSFQSLLKDPTGNFSLGFLRVNSVQLALTVLHLPSLQPLWQPNITKPTLPRWSDRTRFFFNGSLVISEQQSGVLWSTGTKGDKVVLLNTSNLQILKGDTSPNVIWQSFHYPQSILVETQNFTPSMSLVSSNGLYSLRLGDNFMALYAKFHQNAGQMYWKRKALEARAGIIDGQGPIVARVEPDGFFGMYQTGNSPVDLQAFNSYHMPINRFLFVRLEPDGNLKGYLWDGSKWVLDYQAISNTCDLPNPCGSYGLCKPSSGCSCLDRGTEFKAGECFTVQYGDFCSDGENKSKTQNDFWVLRRKGVELPFKELMGYKTVSSLEQCEGLCERNCSCWGAVYNNGSGFCYFVDYPIQTLLSVEDDSKAGYFKVREGERKKMEVGASIGVGILSGGIAILIGAIGFFSYRIWKRRRGILEEEISPGPYKDLGSASFRSIEMGIR